MFIAANCPPMLLTIPLIDIWNMSQNINKLKKSIDFGKHSSNNGSVENN
jgi:hypothetical protein